MKRRFCPELEELGARILPSVTASFLRPDLQAATFAPSSHAGDHKHPLTGHGSGSFSSNLFQADMGLTYHLDGTAHLVGLGQVKVVGDVSGIGFIVMGRASGKLTFTTSRGSVTVVLQGPNQAGFSPLPHYFHYQTISGTGAFLHLADSGTVRIDFYGLSTGTLAESGSFSLAI
jgi:hypothetical protein